ncbi:DegT/DnrJ/EryC1/StrS family aminotransferase [Candidatus Poribacteria bacterium]|nr:DegT/DnrJ/EryC1/StrS family aminotransferase [Candidatus Poribacteria bacterium]
MSARKLALLGGTPVGAPSQQPHPKFSEQAMDRVRRLLETGSTVGLSKGHPEIREAEQSIAEWQGVPYCLGTSSGHGALHAALMGLEVTGGDEVITTPYTWGASTSCILHNGAVPVFVDVEPETGLLDPAAIEPAITDKTRAILAVHIYGQPANMTAIRQVTDRHGLVVIEDGSQAHGSVHQGRRVGQFGDAAGFSCMGGKLLASSEAGYMVTPHANVYWKASMGCQHMGRWGEEGFPAELRPYVDSLVYTYRLSPINAVLLTEQLRKLDAENKGRNDNAGIFRAAVQGVESYRLPDYGPGDQPVYHMLTGNFVPEHAGVSRATYAEAIRAEGVGIFSYVPSPISTWKRLDPDALMPRSMWQETIRASGRRYADCHLPNCERKVARSLEMGWNYTTPNADGMRQLADAFIKVEENLAALRDYERSR